MRCQRCGKMNEPQAGFCEHCGVKLADVCPECGHSPVQGKKFCPMCGAHLQLIFLTQSLKHDRVVQQIDELDLQAELELYKKELESGFLLCTCGRCQTKNRIPKNKVRSNPRCGRCGEPLDIP